MAIEFQVKNVEEFESMIQNMDFKISEALVTTILHNLKSTRRHHHALSVICQEDGDIYDVTIDKKDFIKTLTDSLPKYEKEEKPASDLENLRLQRNNLLSQSDWMSLPDAPTMSDAWKKYRQELRDITKTYKSPDNVKWPTKPE